MHPVRSQHLVDILHQTLDVEETLISLLALIDDNYMYEYFSKIPSLIEDEDYILKELAKRIIYKKFTIIVDAIDGLMDVEPYNYWQKNRKIYDDVYSEGLIQLFVNFNPPFSDLNTLEEMNKSFQTDTLEYILNQKKKLTAFTFEDTLVFKFCIQLANNFYVSGRIKYDDYNGLGYLTKWFQKTKVDVPKILNFSDTVLLEQLKSKEIDEVISLYEYYYIANNEEYLRFIDKNKIILLSILKEKTNSIIVKEQNNELYIQYLVGQNNMDNLFEVSNQRIEIFENLFPVYEKINIEAMYLPFPNNYLYKYMIIDSNKSIPKENLFDKFDIHLNVIWRKTIMRQYSYASNYEWQIYQKDMREISLKFIKECNKLFEYLLEGKKNKDIYPLYKDVFSLMTKEKEFPINTRRYDSKEKFKEELQEIGAYYFSFKNFMRQFIGIIDRTDNRLPIINLKDATTKLGKMQKSLRKIDLIVKTGV